MHVDEVCDNVKKGRNKKQKDEKLGAVNTSKSLTPRCVLVARDLGEGCFIDV